MRFVFSVETVLARRRFRQGDHDEKMMEGGGRGTKGGDGTGWKHNSMRGRQSRRVRKLKAQETHSRHKNVYISQGITNPLQTQNMYGTEYIVDGEYDNRLEEAIAYPF